MPQLRLVLDRELRHEFSGRLQGRKPTTEENAMTDETNNTNDTTAEPARKPGKPKGSTAAPKRVRRNALAELTSLEQRVATAIRLLRRALQTEAPETEKEILMTRALTETAIAELEVQP
jgi:hypothetical protein